MNSWLRAFFHPAPQAVLSVVLGVVGAAGYTACAWAPARVQPVTPTVVVVSVELVQEPRVVWGALSHWGRMPRPEGKDAAGLIIGNSNERLRFVANDGSTIALCACVTYDDVNDAPRMQRDCACTAGSVLATESP